MSDAPRPPNLDEILASAAADEPSEAQIQRLTARLAPLFGPPGGPPSGGQPGDGGAGAAAGGAAGAGKGTLAKWLAGALVAATTAGGGYLAYRSARSERAPRQVATASVDAGTAAGTSPLQADAAPIQGDAAPVEVESGRRAPVQTSEDALAEEARLLGRAQAALGRGNPRAALRWIERHSRRHRDGALAEERERLAIEALLRSGRRSAAEARARRFAGKYPRSVQWPRIRELLDEPAK